MDHPAAQHPPNPAESRQAEEEPSQGHSQDVGNDTQGPHIHSLPVGFLLQELRGWGSETEGRVPARPHAMPSVLPGSTCLTLGMTQHRPWARYVAPRGDPYRPQ